jgi:hypothetical protein
MPSAVIAAAEVAAVTMGSIAVLTEVVTDIDVLSKYAVRIKISRRSMDLM